MDRRQFLLTGASAMLARPAFSAEEDLTLRQLRRQASAEGVALLVVLLPADRPERARRGRIWGEFLSGGRQEELYDLALANRCAATVDELVEEFQLALGEDAHPFAALIEPGAAQPLLLDLAELPRSVANATFPVNSVTGRPVHQHGIDRDGDVARRNRSAALAEALSAFLHPDLDTLLRRSEQLEFAALTRIRGADALRARRLGFATRAATWEDLEPARVRQLRVTYHELSAPFGRPLSVERATLENLDVGPGPGCHGVPCGTAHMPGPGRRFLQLYTAPR